MPRIFLSNLWNETWMCRVSLLNCENFPITIQLKSPVNHTSSMSVKPGGYLGKLSFYLNEDTGWYVSDAFTLQPTIAIIVDFFESNGNWVEIIIPPSLEVSSEGYPITKKQTERPVSICHQVAYWGNITKRRIFDFDDDSYDYYLVDEPYSLMPPVEALYKPEDGSKETDAFLKKAFAEFAKASKDKRTSQMLKEMVHTSSMMSKNPELLNELNSIMTKAGVVPLFGLKNTEQIGPKQDDPHNPPQNPERILALIKRMVGLESIGPKQDDPHNPPQNPERILALIQRMVGMESIGPKQDDPHNPPQNPERVLASIRRLLGTGAIEPK